MPQRSSSKSVVNRFQTSNLGTPARLGRGTLTLFSVLALANNHELHLQRLKYLVLGVKMKPENIHLRSTPYPLANVAAIPIRRRLSCIFTQGQHGHVDGRKEKPQYENGPFFLFL